MTTYNGTGALAGWNWCLSYLVTAGILIGFDASGHVAEETKNTSLNAAKGTFWSTVISGVLGFTAVILFLFTSVSLRSLYAALPGCGGHLVMNLLSIIALWLNTSIATTAASRLVFAVARDGVLVFAAGVPSAAAYGLISLGRLTLTRHHKLDAKWSLGKWRTRWSLNYAPIIMAIVTVFAVVSWWLTPADARLRQESVEQAGAASTGSGDK
ncbi:uncharacterized protein BO97DRAFT_428067 [Aspergillus homomorphus CBS 101889]|uniref:Uncharacterized protein n=1 Tax=Aspergillus homomorphus (strain CBS 101889) TaxID=1450537 RepID=A0A395HMV6_ASPHC|nr:hypothetical protein BO97DRAFT_428067 [Aspergillus homomorphus CBS 101889]RAL08753.1 hypothetical protein BO97DRAFT_428067 [Aspergillus homomorphus CBS 101889]